MRLWTLVFTLLPFLAIGQTDNKKLVDSLKYVTDMPYICETGEGFGCGDKVFWKVVQKKQAILPFLFDMLADTTTTLAAVPNLGGQWTVGDVAYNAIQEIIKGIPTFELLGVEFDKSGCGYCAYWNYLRIDINNRKKFQARVRDWYGKNKGNLIWVTSDQFMTCDCSGQHPNHGHFELKK